MMRIIEGFLLGMGVGFGLKAAEYVMHLLKIG